MKRKLTSRLFILSFVAVCLVSCSRQDDLVQGTDATEYGDLEVLFGGSTRSTTTTISPEEAKNFLITVSQGSGEDETIIRGPQTLGTMNMRFPVGQGYAVYAESCTETDAEQNNNQWGQKRFVGKSEPFGVYKGQTTKVNVGMKVENSALCVVVHPSLANYFKTSCTVSLTNEDRGLVWNYDNAGRVEDGETTDGQIAYFNIDETGSRTIKYTINAVAGDRTITKEGSITLARAKMSRLNLAYNSGFFTLTIDINQEDLYEESDIVVGVQDVIPDDGATDASGSNDDFNLDDSVVDYDQYN